MVQPPNNHPGRLCLLPYPHEYGERNLKSVLKSVCEYARNNKQLKDAHIETETAPITDQNRYNPLVTITICYKDANNQEVKEEIGQIFTVHKTGQKTFMDKSEKVLAAELAELIDIRFRRLFHQS